jgi:uncharacterized membrane protein YozB (DUF420 family)
LDPKVAYWTGAWINMLGIVGLTFAGVRHARRADYELHRRRMLQAVGLVILFLVSYPVKLALLGRESLELWHAGYVFVLRFHELCVAAMILGGGYGLAIALRRGMPMTTPDHARTHRRHRLAGRSAIVGAVAGVLTAGAVLFGMYARMP